MRFLTAAALYTALASSPLQATDFPSNFPQNARTPGPMPRDYEHRYFRLTTPLGSRFELTTERYVYMKFGNPGAVGLLERVSFSGYGVRLHFRQAPRVNIKD